MCVSWRYPDNTIPAILYVKSNDGKLYPIQPLNDNSAVYSTLYSKINKLGLKFLYDRSSEEKPKPENYIATNPTSDYIINYVRYTYQINSNSAQSSPTYSPLLRNGEIFTVPDYVLASSVTLPCTLVIGKELYYWYGNGDSGYGYYYARSGEQTVEITEPGTYHAEKITTGNGIYLGSPPKWYGFSTDILVEESGSAYKITAKDFTLYTLDAAKKYKAWLDRPQATTIQLDTNGNGTKSIDLTEITNRIEELEQRVAELEALHNNG